jgi:ADP-ribose pyrophosphatase
MRDDEPAQARQGGTAATDIAHVSDISADTQRMEPWKTVARKVVFEPDGGRYLTVEQHAIELPNGDIIDDWMWLRTPDFVNVLVQTLDGDFLVFRQTKYAVDGVTMAVVGGYIEPDEDPVVAARREVIEETGWECRDVLSLGAYAIDGNRGVGQGHLFLATGAEPVPTNQQLASDDLEEQELLRLDRDQLLAALQAGEFKIASWTATIALSLLHLSPLS